MRKKKLFNYAARHFPGDVTEFAEVRIFIKYPTAKSQ